MALPVKLDDYKKDHKLYHDFLDELAGGFCSDISVCAVNVILNDDRASRVPRGPRRSIGIDYSIIMKTGGYESLHASEKPNDRPDETAIKKAITEINQLPGVTPADQVRLYLRFQEIGCIFPRAAPTDPQKNCGAILYRIREDGTLASQASQPTERKEIGQLVANMYFNPKFLKTEMKVNTSGGWKYINHGASDMPDNLPADGLVTLYPSSANQREDLRVPLFEDSSFYVNSHPLVICNIKARDLIRKEPNIFDCSVDRSRHRSRSQGLFFGGMAFIGAAAALLASGIGELTQYGNIILPESQANRAYQTAGFNNNLNEVVPLFTLSAAALVSGSIMLRWFGRPTSVDATDAKR